MGAAGGATEPAGAEEPVTEFGGVTTLPGMPSWSALALALALTLPPTELFPGPPLEGAAVGDELVEAFVRAGVEDRDALLEQILSSTTDADALAAIGTRLQRHQRTIGRGSTAAKLDKLLVARGELDAARRQFFAIVEDEERYFTPYRQPEVNAEREAEYRRTQKEVERLVGSLEDLWSGARPVKLSRKVRAAIEDVQWGIEACAEIDGAAAHPEWIRPWMLGVDAELAVVGVAEIGLDARERDRLRDWRAIRRVNDLRGESALEDRKGEELSRPDRAALEQVRITNDYRVMLGRRPLLWNPRLQLAARGHSDHMSRSGILSHYEEDDPERRLPSQRARLAGYRHFQAENCSFGLPSPLEAHRAWTTSPGHHRNIVFASHTEMASSLSGAYWTQKFGRRPLDIEDELSTVQAASGKKGRR